MRFSIEVLSLPTLPVRSSEAQAARIQALNQPQFSNTKKATVLSFPELQLRGLAFREENDFTQNLVH